MNKIFMILMSGLWVFGAIIYMTERNEIMKGICFINSTIWIVGTAIVQAIEDSKERKP